MPVRPILPCPLEPILVVDETAVLLRLEMLLLSVVDISLFGLVLDSEESLLADGRRLGLIGSLLL